MVDDHKIATPTRLEMKESMEQLITTSSWSPRACTFPKGRSTLRWSP